MAPPAPADGPSANAGHRSAINIGSGYHAAVLLAPGQDTPWTQPPGALRLAALVRAEQNPVVVYSEGDYAEAAVSSRSLVQTGVR